MIPDDQFETRRLGVSRELSEWADEFRDVISADKSSADNMLRFTVEPHAEGACPFEIGIRDDQRYDIAVGDQFFEDQAVEDFTLFAKLARAIGDGRVIRRELVSPLSGQLLFLQIIIGFAGSGCWLREKIVAERGDVDRSELIARDRHYVPYKGAGMVV